MSAHRWAILLVMTLLLVTSSCAVASAQSASGSVVKIDAPSKNGKAGPSEPVSGRAQLSKGYSLWIVPYDPAGGKYYPQTSTVAVRSNAAWSTRLSVGNVFRVGKTFQIHAVVADPSASSALGVAAAQRTGIAKLPPGAQAVDAVTVTRVAADVAAAPSASTTSTASQSVTAAANRSATSVATARVVAKSQNPLPGFEALYALGSLAAISVALRLKREH